jgi:HEAT repeat protein
MNGYPPNQEECKKLFQELQELDAKYATEYHVRKYEIIHDLAEAKYYEARPYFIRGLRHPDPDYRWEAISALATHWQDDDPEVVALLMEMALNDSDVQVRMIAISSLGYLGIRSAVPLLKQILQDDSQGVDILDSARRSLSALNDGEHST